MYNSQSLEDWLFSKNKGLIAVAVIGLAIAAMLAHGDADPLAQAMLKRWIIAEYDTHHQSRKDVTVEDRINLTQAAAGLRFKSISARGRAKSMSFKIEIEPNAAHPPGSPLTRYYTMEYSPLTGWNSPVRSQAWGHFLALFFL